MVLQILPIWHPTKPKPWTPPAMRYRRSLWWKIRKRKSPLVLPHTVRESIFGTWQRLKGHLSRNRTWYSLLARTAKFQPQRVLQDLGFTSFAQIKALCNFPDRFVFKTHGSEPEISVGGFVLQNGLTVCQIFLLHKGQRFLFGLDLAYQRFKLCLCCLDW